MPIIDIVDNEKNVLGTENIFFYKSVRPGKNTDVFNISELPRAYIILDEINEPLIDNLLLNFYVGRAEWSLDQDKKYLNGLIKKYSLIASISKQVDQAESTSAPQIDPKIEPSNIPQAEPTEVLPDPNELLDALKRIVFSHDKIKSNKELTKCVKSIGICIDNSREEIKKAIGTARRILFQEIKQNMPAQGEDIKILEDALKMIVGNYDSIVAFIDFDMAIEAIGITKKRIENEILSNEVQLEITDSIIIQDAMTASIAMSHDTLS